MIILEVPVSGVVQHYCFILRGAANIASTLIYIDKYLNAALPFPRLQTSAFDSERKSLKVFTVVSSLVCLVFVSSVKSSHKREKNHYL